MDNPVTGTAKKQGFALLVFSISLAMFMTSLDGTIVNIALPTLSESFNVSTSTVSWVATSYLLVLVGCVLVFGKVSDTLGYKRLFLSGFVIFTIGSFFCGFLPEFIAGFPSLIASRMFQAVGAAMLMSVAAAMISTFVSADQKGKAMSIIMMIAALGTALGPTIGGLLTQYLSWHWIFFINIPVGIVAILLGAKVIPASCPVQHEGGFDRLGSVLAFIALASLVFVVSEGPVFGWTSPVILGMAVLMAVSLGWFVKNELSAQDPVLDIRLFKKRNFVIANLILILVFFSLSGINYLLPFYLKYVRSYDTSTAGLIMTALSFAMMVAGLIAGVSYNRVGARRLCILASLPLVLGYLLMTMLRTYTPTGFVIIALALIGFGLGLIVSPITTMIMMSVSKSKAGMLSSLTSLERTGPMCIGIATYNALLILGIILIAKRHEITMEAPATIKMEVLSVGFDIAFMLSLILGIVILVLSIAVKEEVHPDYAAEEKVLVRNRE
ncbi:DHA2 family efflux MFS transporter permease subunit [Methanoregula sp.]|uniref:DHA2 family efflux MFS transporter permease subunit n=1 Tax=Methanoregula sp. TaxID=2052170 RepID=UPI002637ED2B|nr:DHA2 family efflux MFS transporter permease subunit [Methanoregula sp.]MDD5142971.1 DHA2 family efflux MFS transporter permease subunit [Methanoregula sp.]